MGGKRNRADDFGTGSQGCIHNFLDRLVNDAVVEGLEFEADAAGRHIRKLKVQSAKFKVRGIKKASVIEALFYHIGGADII